VSDAWPEILEKVAEYLGAGVSVVVFLDPEPKTSHIFGAIASPTTLGPEDDLVLPGILDGLRVRVAQFFE
jgi:hypothetical protein